ncbi:unnamed protein product [Rangifer tarandus platyrhynchus]|uniref:Uncharacterized protein n=1 Tax=Rangifer tarandus platyrhynchus TaxID=3082113 RepID=A0ABN8ZXU5_RANTA|nr:unnamed protein product [Rangifer tarandus platyrhynchus]
MRTRRGARPPSLAGLLLRYQEGALADPSALAESAPATGPEAFLTRRTLPPLADPERGGVSFGPTRGAAPGSAGEGGAGAGRQAEARSPGVPGDGRPTGGTG